MGLYNFQERFVKYVQDGSKCHTIRAIRKNFTKVGDTMHLYTGLRRLKPAIKLLQPFPPCTAKRTIFIMKDQSIYLSNEIVEKREAEDMLKWSTKVLLNALKKTAKDLTHQELLSLVYHDGFRDENNDLPFGIDELFFRFWNQTHDLPFIGHLDVWHPDPSQLIYLK